MLGAGSENKNKSRAPLLRMAAAYSFPVSKGNSAWSWIACYRKQGIHAALVDQHRVENADLFDQARRNRCRCAPALGGMQCSAVDEHPWLVLSVLDDLRIDWHGLGPGYSLGSRETGNRKGIAGSDRGLPGGHNCLFLCCLASMARLVGASQ
jgi:hypothetical protein